MVNVSDCSDTPPSVESIVVFISQCFQFRHNRLTSLVIPAMGRVICSNSVAEPDTAPTNWDSDPSHLGLVTATGLATTAYEMKTRPVSRDDIDRAMQKVVRLDPRPENYIFVTTETIDAAVQTYASSLYAATNGIEFAILDCLGFLRHFLHLFHRHRTAFLDTYQNLVLAEPDSAVSFELKQAFLALRGAAMQPPTPEA